MERPGRRPISVRGHPLVVGLGALPGRGGRRFFDVDRARANWPDRTVRAGLPDPPGAAP